MLTRLFIASRTPPPQGLRQVRLLPDPVHCRWSSPIGQQRPWPVQYRREEEGLLSQLVHTEPCLQVQNRKISCATIFSSSARFDRAVQFMFAGVPEIWKASYTSYTSSYTEDSSCLISYIEKIYLATRRRVDQFNNRFHVQPLRILIGVACRL